MISNPGLPERDTCFFDYFLTVFFQPANPDILKT